MIVSMGTKKGLPRQDAYLHPSFLFLLVVCTCCLQLLSTHSLLNPTKSVLFFFFLPTSTILQPQMSLKDLLIAAQFDTPHYTFLQSLPSPGPHDTAARVFKHFFSSRTLLSNGILPRTPSD